MGYTRADHLASLGEAAQVLLSFAEELDKRPVTAAGAAEIPAAADAKGSAASAPSRGMSTTCRRIRSPARAPRRGASGSARRPRGRMAWQRPTVGSAGGLSVARSSVSAAVSARYLNI